MRNKDNKELFFRWNVITNVCMALSVNTAATILAGGSSVSEWVKGCCAAFSVNTLAAIIIPMGLIVNWFVFDIVKAKENSLVEMILRNLVVNAIYVTIVSLSMALINVGVTRSVLHIWWSTYPILHLVGLVTSIVIEVPVKLAVYGRDR